MKTNLSAVASLFSALVCQALAAPLSSTTAVHTKPDASSPAITYLKAGTEPTAASNTIADTPAGWMAVELPGPIEGFVLSRDLTKGLDVKPGTPIRKTPEANAAVLTIAAAGDKSTITGLHGRWTQVAVNKPLIGYINVGGTPGYLPPVATTPASSNVNSSSAAPLASTPLTDYASAAAPNNLPGQPAVSSSAADSANLPRQLTGKFVSTRSVLHPRRPYDWALVDNSGKRFAYVDISRLLLTDRLEKYIDHFVVVFGAAKPTNDGRDIVIQAESLQLLLR
jgi:hypothetical protein